MQEMPVQSLGQEDPLEEELAAPLQYSCLGNPMDRGTWWVTVCEAAKSRTQLNSEHTHTHEETAENQHTRQTNVVQMFERIST